MPAEHGGLASRGGPTVLLERWHTYWGWLFYGLLVAATGLAAADVDSVATMATLDVRSRSLLNLSAGRIPLNHAG